jgi:hypothetical protein
VNAHSAAEKLDLEFDWFQHAYSAFLIATPGYDGCHMVV